MRFRLSFFFLTFIDSLRMIYNALRIEKYIV